MSLLKNYIHDPTHMIDCNLVQVELEGEFQVEPLNILDRRKITLQNRVVAQVKVQWKHFSPGGHMGIGGRFVEISSNIVPIKE